LIIAAPKEARLLSPVMANSISQHGHGSEQFRTRFVPRSIQRTQKPFSTAYLPTGRRYAKLNGTNSYEDFVDRKFRKTNSFTVNIAYGLPRVSRERFDLSSVLVR
jgi:hypothetical protein